MSIQFLDFEQPIAELEAKIEELRLVNQGGEFDVGIEEDINKLRGKSAELTKKIFSDLGAWQVSQLARHPMRPYTLDYIPRIFTDFDELAGDRAFADDKAILGGPAMLDGQPVMVIGHQKGRDTNKHINICVWMSNTQQPLQQLPKQTYVVTKKTTNIHITILNNKHNNCS